MVDFTKIQNPLLRILVSESASIATLSDEQKTMIVEKIANMPPEGQGSLMAALTEEKQQMQKPVTSTISYEKVSKSTNLLKGSMNAFHSDVRKIQQTSMEQNDSSAAKNLLTKI